MIIEVTNRKGERFEVIFDDDFELSNKIHISHYGYASARIKGKLTLLHRLIMNAERGQVIDHINGNKLDNRKENLRFVTRQQNNTNVRGKGYYFNGHSFVVSVRKDKKKHHIGSFKTEEAAQEAYRKAHAEIHGEYSPYKEAAVNG